MDGGVPVVLGVSDEVLLVVSDDVPLVDAAAVGVGTVALRVCVGLLAVVVSPGMIAGVVEEEEGEEEEVATAETLLEP